MVFREAVTAILFHLFTIHLLIAAYNWSIRYFCLFYKTVLSIYLCVIREAIFFVIKFTIETSQISYKKA